MYSEQEKSQYQRGREAYFETQKRKRKLSEKDRKLFEQLEKVKIGGHDVGCSVVLMIANVYQNNAIDAFDTIFKLGFMKGQRAEKARLKRKAAV